MLIGALEAGGTKMVCAIGKEDGTILEQVSIPTTTPEETIPKLIEYFKDKEIEALGVAAFGPVDVKPESETYGYILDTPKLAWRHKDLLGRLKAELKVPMGLDTDVNGSCLGEVTYGCARGLDSVIHHHRNRCGRGRMHQWKAAARNASPGRRPHPSGAS